MGMYESFARVYDIFMDEVPYGEWCARLTALLEENGIRDGLVLDLACGTGSMTRLLSQAGYDMIGADSSPEMLEIAREKTSEKEAEKILYLMQDMRSFELYGTVRAVISVCDSLNYVTEEEDLLQVFRLVNNYLDPGGVFLFDVNTHYKYEVLIGDRTIAETRDECSFIWENSWYPEEKINEYDLTLFVREEEDLYRRFTETHYQKAWPAQQIAELLRKAGFDQIQAFDGYSSAPADRESERILFCARECMKKTQDNNTENKEAFGEGRL